MGQIPEDDFFLVILNIFIQYDDHVLYVLHIFCAKTPQMNSQVFKSSANHSHCVITFQEDSSDRSTLQIMSLQHLSLAYPFKPKIMK